jgi:hypothetical protein
MNATNQLIVYVKSHYSALLRFYSTVILELYSSVLIRSSLQRSNLSQQAALDCFCHSSYTRRLIMMYILSVYSLSLLLFAVNNIASVSIETQTSTKQLSAESLNVSVASSAI